MFLLWKVDSPFLITHSVVISLLHFDIRYTLPSKVAMYIVLWIESLLQQLDWTLKVGEHYDLIPSFLVPFQSLDYLHYGIELGRRFNQGNLLNPAFLDGIVVIFVNLRCSYAHLTQSLQCGQNVRREQFFALLVESIQFVSDAVVDFALRRI